MRHVTEATAVLSLAVVMLSGCEPPAINTGRPEVATNSPANNGEATYLDKMAVRGDREDESDSAVEAALEWAQRYAEATGKLQQQQESNRALTQSNEQIKQQLAKAQFELWRAEKELDEAVDMLLEMRKELEKWKANVLGFRAEMRQAEKAQLDALGRILKLIGGELAPPPGETATAGPVTQPAAAPTEEIHALDQ